MSGIYEHIRFQKETRITDKRPGSRFPRQIPDSPKNHARALKEQLQQTRAQLLEDTPGFDDRMLLRLSVQQGIDPSIFERIPGIETISQEDEAIALIFATQAALDEFEMRLSSMMQGDKVTNKDIIYAVSALGSWSREDRIGPALAREGMPTTGQFLLDVELWPLPRGGQRDAMIDAFESDFADQDCEYVDRVNAEAAVIFRFRATKITADFFLRHRDVRQVDLPPLYGINRESLEVSVQNLPNLEAPEENAPRIGILDSGISSQHPLLSDAVGDNQDFLEPGGPARDDYNHGTGVAGIALHGDVGAASRSSRVQANFWILSGKFLDKDGNASDRFLTNQIQEAVVEFQKRYGCKIFNLSFGDLRHPYGKGRLATLAVLLDEIAREHGVLFIIAAGNYEGPPGDKSSLRDNYPTYLSQEDARIIDPATAINALTVGSLARYDQSFPNQSFPEDPGIQPIARFKQPSPFTRTGPTIRGIIKPDFVDFGGNTALDVRGGHLVKQGLGEVTLNGQFANERLLRVTNGTSLAAPRVTHYAAGVLRELPHASCNLIKAVLAVHASQPEECKSLITNKADVLNTVGYGLIDPDSLYKSGDDVVTLYAEESIADRTNQFFEIPIPPDFFSGPKRIRELHIALAHTPAVRSTRVSYKATRLSFTLVSEPSLDRVMSYFQGKPSEEIEKMEEFGAAQNKTIGKQDRSRGALQKSSWILRQPRKSNKFFVVVTRNDETWARDLTRESEDYALAILLTDRENANARLHSQIREILNARQRARPSVRGASGRS